MFKFPRLVAAVFVALSLILPAALLSATAVQAEEGKAPAKTEGKKAPAKSAKKSGDAKKAKAEPVAQNEDQVKQEFESFAQEFVSKLNANLICTADKKEIVTRDGKYVARYSEVDRSSMVLDVQPYASAQTPFVGTIKYVECMYECEADNPAAAQNGPFAVVKSTPTTEVFRYTNKRWFY